jgi:hypothetical protein
VLAGCRYSSTLGHGTLHKSLPHARFRSHLVVLRCICLSIRYLAPTFSASGFAFRPPVISSRVQRRIPCCCRRLFPPSAFPPSFLHLGDTCRQLQRSRQKSRAYRCAWKAQGMMKDYTPGLQTRFIWRESAVGAASLLSQLFILLTTSYWIRFNTSSATDTMARILEILFMQRHRCLFMCGSDDLAFCADCATRNTALSCK